MTNVFVGEKELVLVLEEKVVKKANQLNVSEDDIKNILQNNEKALQEPENEEVLIVGYPTLTFIKTPDTIIVTNLMGQKSVL
ncbi:hypothetical protein CVD28_01040 [Bacillus sp. M6-12]|uniref:hypothetical protein n=1 Tax=Bacillus sp. M6-12 TaxID=2054166 RepID=UPI000C785616|nr:hypothetical protein [Bacillus sp. M6-12]PLS19019.1 hypothetical protein CVD28_01040 [Bacillus sp. M6-12]